jgi:hypothetical protein
MVKLLMGERGRWSRRTRGRRWNGPLPFLVGWLDFCLCLLLSYCYHFRSRPSVLCPALSLPSLPMEAPTILPFQLQDADLNSISA